MVAAAPMTLILPWNGTVHQTRRRRARQKERDTREASRSFPFAPEGAGPAGRAQPTGITPA